MKDGLQQTWTLYTIGLVEFSLFNKAVLDGVCIAEPEGVGPDELELLETVCKDDWLLFDDATRLCIWMRANVNC